MTTSSDETPFFSFPTEISTERIRVCRDHASRAKTELGLLITKLPEIQRKSFGHIQYGEQVLLLDSTDVISLVTQLLSFVDTEYELRRQADKKEKKKEKKNKKKSHLTLIKDKTFVFDDLTEEEWEEYERSCKRAADNRKKYSYGFQTNKVHARILKRKPTKQLLTNAKDSGV